MNVMTLEEVSQRLEEVKYNTIDLDELGKATVNFEPAQQDDQSDFSVAYQDNVFALDLNAEKQFLGMMNIPHGFYKRLPSEMREEIFNHCAREEDIWKKPLCLKERNQRIFAFLKESYGINNQELIDELMKMNTWNRFNLFQAHVSDHKFDFRALVAPPEALDTINARGDKAIKMGDMYPGVHIQNGETGRVFKVLPVIFRVRCCNGLITPWKTMTDGFRIPSYREYSKITGRMQELVIRSLIYAQENEQRFRQLMNTKVDNPSELLTRFSEEYQISDDMRKEALQQLNYPGEEDIAGTAYAIVNAVTAAARKEEDPDKRVKLEQIGWKIAERRMN